MKTIVKALGVGLAMCPLLLTPALAQTTSAGQLFRSQKGAGFKISVERRRDGVIRMLTPENSFQTGDEVKLHFTPNFDGYVYALNEGSSGETNLVFPTPETGMDNRVRAGREYIIPATDGWLKFVGKPGVENVLMIASPGPMPELAAEFRSPRPAPVLPSAAPPEPPASETLSRLDIPIPAVTIVEPPQQRIEPLPPPVQQQPPRNSPPSNSKDASGISKVNSDVGKVSGGISTANRITKIPKQAIGVLNNVRKRDLVLEDDAQEGATYVSSDTATLAEPIYFKIELVHQ